MKFTGLKFCFLTVVLSFLLCGCGTMAKVGSIFHPSQTTAPAVTSAQPATPPPTVGGTVKTEVVFMWIAAALLALGAGAMAYFGNWLTAAKLGAAALALPIIATFISLYWAWIVAGALVALAAYVFMHYRTVIMPAIETATANLQKKI